MEVATPISPVKEKVLCYHCGEACPDASIAIGEKNFCCDGCKTVFEILDENGLCQYYDLENSPGISLKSKNFHEKYAYLDDPAVIAKLADFSNEQLTKVTFEIPQIHCASCIWLLENLYKLRDGITASTANFLKSQVAITFVHKQISLRQVVELLATLGYEPELNLGNLERKSLRQKDKTFFYKLGIAGFCFGNIMLLSFPEYLSLDRYLEPEFARFFGYLNIALSLPVLLYSSTDYFESAINGFKARILNIDVPISLGILVLFSRSVFDILTHSGPGYLDSMAGLVFFLLIGKWFQNKTYQRLSFERDYKSYFPLSVTRKTNGKAEAVPISNLEIGDQIEIKNRELIPADSLLLSGVANIDYSFVTGEAEPVKVEKGHIIFAGGRQVGGAIDLQVTKKTAQSYLTGLWENDVFKAPSTELSAIVNQVSKYFTPVVLIIATLAALYWMTVDRSMVLYAFTSVLIVACPCALALATPFTLGNALRILGKHKIFLKNNHVIERLAHIGHIVFDKTGTITYSGSKQSNFEGGTLTGYEKSLVKTLTKQSAHPLSQIIYRSLEVNALGEVQDFSESPGLGIEGQIDHHLVKIGSGEFVSGKTPTEDSFTKSWVSINGKIKGYFSFSHHYRQDLERLADDLNKTYRLSLLSGDNAGEKPFLANIFPEDQLFFNQTPADKLQFVKSLQESGDAVLMVGDGLNDAGALKQSDVGISVSENTNNFSPACDAILDSSVFGKLNIYIDFSKASMAIVKACFVLSFIYNMTGLYFAFQGLLSPVIAAVLMPLSSITVVLFGTLATSLAAKRYGL